MSRPVVALTSYLEPARWGAWDTRAVLLHDWYVDKLRGAGAHPVLVPPGETDAEVLDRVDALVLTGGADVDPRRYGAEPGDHTDVPRVDRDESELLFYRAARDRGMPVLGICRGLQVMAVAEGGSLHQHLPDVVGNTLHRDAPGTFNDHGATFAADSLVARILGTTAMTVNSSHHQCVADAGRLTVTGWASDGTIEVCEDPSAPFLLGVQWHPEKDDDPRLFDALVAAC